MLRTVPGLSVRFSVSADDRSRRTQMHEVGSLASNCPNQGVHDVTEASRGHEWSVGNGLR